MKSTIAFVIVCLVSSLAISQRPCSGTIYRQFDFWVGEWEVYGVKGKKAGDSKISLILDSCVVLEEWTSVGITQGVRYAGKSFNRYNAANNQWQQTWVDNIAGNTEYDEGKYEDNKIVFKTKPFEFVKDSMALRRLTFFNVDKNKVRQLGEISKDNGTTWIIEFDLEYRRKS